MASPARPVSSDIASRTSFIRNLLQADQTQLQIMTDTAPAAKILREVREIQQ
jgi:ethanolamine utilization cobalamin adenosyltransferase